MHGEPEPIGPLIEKLIDGALLRQPLPEALSLRRAELVREAGEELAGLMARAAAAYGEIVLREVEVLFTAGFPREKCLTPAYNNTALRKKAIEEELIREVGRVQGDLRRRLLRLIEDAAGHHDNDCDHADPDAASGGGVR
jgi:hypothetical protein